MGYLIVKMTKQYILWKRKKITDNLFNDPVGVEGMTETGYTNDGITFVGVIDKEVNSDVIKDLTDFEPIEKTVQEIFSLLNEWYGDYFELEEDGFTLIDNIPIEEEENIPL